MREGRLDGLDVGVAWGWLVGIDDVGCEVGRLVSPVCVGLDVTGAQDGLALGRLEGCRVGLAAGCRDGRRDGRLEGCLEG